MGTWLQRVDKTQYRFLVTSGCLRSTISHINYWGQVNSWKNLWKFWNCLLCRNKLGSSPYSVLQHKIRVATSKLLPRNCLRSNNDNWGNEDDLRTYVSYCLKESMKRGVWKNPVFLFGLKSLFLMFDVCQMVLWLIIYFDPQKIKVSNLMKDVMIFCY